MIVALTALLLLQQGQTTVPATPVLQASPVARIALTPGRLVVPASDSIHLTAVAYDAKGAVVPNAHLRFGAAAANGGTIDTSGWVIARGTGKVTGSVISLIPGFKPYVHRFEVLMVADAPASLRLGALPARMVVGQRARATADVYTKVDDRRESDPIKWASSAPKVVAVDADGMLTALAPGKSIISATDAPATSSAAVQVVANSIADIDITPRKLTARTGDVVRFSATPKDAAGKPVTGLTPTWSFSPGKGQLDADGAFVAYEAGTYVVTANYGNRSSDAVVKIDLRDVRRPVRVVGRLPRTTFPTSEVWIHPNGKVAYLGTHGGGDRVYTIDISNPGDPVIVDSIQANTRLVNDMMTTADGNYMVFTREGAADRKNGIVIADTHDPLHP
ncbi:MAG: Ig-like domain-containing protein, partial [bacterium]